LATWWFGIPSSSSHALVGGLAGAVVAAVGSEYVIWGWSPLMHDGKLLGVMKVLVSLFLSPVLGFWCGFLVFRIARKLMAGEAECQ
jgi:PiT family inorganic phosphate transporter